MPWRTAKNDGVIFLESLILAQDERWRCALGMQVERAEVGDQRSDVGFANMLKGMIKSYEDLEVYQRSKKLYPRLISYLRSFPSEGRFLKDQSARAGNAIHSDIAEGYGRSVNEFKMYLTRSLGSCNELKSHLEDAINLGYGNIQEAKELIEEYTIISKQLYRLREKWN